MECHSAIKKKEQNNCVCRNMDRPRDSHTEWGQTETQTPNDITYMWNLKNNTNEFIYKTETDTQT